MKQVLVGLLFLLLCISCSTGTDADKHQGKRKDMPER